jgi:sec-independent protein translocase protein TatC
MSEDSEFGPESDVDQPLEDHIEELLARVLVIFSIGISISLLFLPISDLIIEFLWNLHIPNSNISRPRLYGPFSLIFTRFRLLFLISLFISLPVLIYQCYKFASVGLYKKEVYYIKQISVMSIVLSFVSLIISNLVLIPVIFKIFNSYSDTTADIAYGLQDTVGLMLTIMIYLIFVFHIPILIIMAINIELVSIEWLTERRLVFWITFISISFIAGSIDPTGVIPIIISIIMITLFEATIFVLKKSNN